MRAGIWWGKCPAGATGRPSPPFPLARSEPARHASFARSLPVPRHLRHCPLAGWCPDPLNPGPKSRRNLEPTAGFEPATRYLQNRPQLNSARDFRFPCIPWASITSKEFHRLGYRIGYRKAPKSAPPTPTACRISLRLHLHLDDRVTGRNLHHSLTAQGSIRAIRAQGGAHWS